MTTTITQSKVKTYEIAWVKNYYATGTELIEADSEEEALKIAKDNIGDYTGNMDYDPDADWVESYGVKTSE